MAKYWFRRRQGLMSKDLGWGYMPISREGWFVMFSFLLVICLIAIITLSTIKNQFLAGITMGGLIILMIFVIVIVGELKVRKPEGK